MTPPELAALRFAVGAAFGMGLGVLWDLLKPLSRQHPLICDLLFAPVLVWAWLEHGFGVCQGDLRLGYTAALGVGWAVWEMTLGRALTRPVAAVWGAFGRVLGRIIRPFEKILKKILTFFKKRFAYLKKWVTIRWNNRRPMAAGSGGRTHEKNHEVPSPHQAGGS